MEGYVVEEILKECKWYEKIIVKIFKKTFMKIYHNTRINLVNNMLKY